MSDEGRGLLTERERAILLGERDASDDRYDAVVERARERIDLVERDLEALDEHGGLADELRDVVCGARHSARAEEARRGAHPGGSPATAVDRNEGADTVVDDGDGDADDGGGIDGGANEPERGPESAPTDDAPRTSSGGAPLAGVDFPADRGREACEAAVFAARDYLRERGPASRSELVADVMPEHPLGYDVPAAELDDADGGAWWSEVVRPGLEALPEAEEEEDDGEGWRYRAPDFEGGV